jgi:hypothetical protein
MYIIYFLPFYSLLISIFYLLISRYYKKLRTISLYSFGFALLNCAIDVFLIYYTDSNQIDTNILEFVRNFQIIFAVITILLPLLLLKNKGKAD